VAIGARPGVTKQQSQRILHQLARDRHATADADAVSPATAVNGGVKRVDSAGSGGKLIQI